MKHYLLDNFGGLPMFLISIGIMIFLTGALYSITINSLLEDSTPSQKLLDNKEGLTNMSNTLWGYGVPIGIGIFAMGVLQIVFSDEKKKETYRSDGTKV